MRKPRQIKILRVKHRPGCNNGDAEGVCDCRRVELVDLTPKLLADLRRQAKAGGRVYLSTAQAICMVTGFDGTLSAPAREAIFGDGR